MNNYQEYKLTKFYRSLLLTMVFSAAILTVGFLVTFDDSQTRLISVPIGIGFTISALSVFLLSLKFKVVQKNLDYILFGLLSITTIGIILTNYLTNFRPEYAIELVFLTVFTSLMPIRNSFLSKLYLLLGLVLTGVLTLLLGETEIKIIPFYVIYLTATFLSFVLISYQVDAKSVIERLLQLINSSPNLIIQFNRSGKIIFANDVAKERIPELEERGLSHFVSPDLYDDEGRFKPQMLSKKIYQLRHQDRVYSLSFKKLSDDNYILFGNESTDKYEISESLDDVRERLERQQRALLNVLEDVTQEKEFEESQSKTLLSSVGEGIVVTDDEGRVVFSNRSFANLTGYSASDIEGEVFSEQIRAFTVQGKEIPGAEMSDAAMVTASNNESKFLIEGKNGKKTHVLVNASPIVVRGEFKGVIRIMHDISEQVKLQQQKDDFFSIASHELRTPLTVIAGNLDIVLQGYGKSKISGEDRELLEDTIKASDRLIKMVNDFLNVSRLDQERLKYDMIKLDAADLTETIVKEIKNLTEDKGVYLKFRSEKEHIFVEADEGLFREIVINLVGNAAKFTKEGGITVDLREESESLALRVIDTGVGIAADKKDILFQRFQQAMDRTLAREAGGTGLGLYISREFARKMKGDLILEKTELGKGTTFKFTLPLAKEELEKK